MLRKTVLFASLLLGALPSATAVADPARGVLVAPFRLEADQTVYAVVNTPTESLPVGTKALATTVRVTEPSPYAWLRSLMGLGDAQAVSTCVSSLVLPDQRRVTAWPGECLGIIVPDGGIELASVDPLVVRAGSHVQVLMAMNGLERLRQ